MSQQLADFYRALQISLQNNIHTALDEVADQVTEAGASLGDLSFCFGSVFGSVLFELMRDNEETMSEEQKEMAQGMIEPFVVGFSEKLELLTQPNPDRMEVVKQ